MSNNIGTSFSVSANGSKGFTSGGIGGFEFMIQGIGYPVYKNNNPSDGPYLGGGMKGFIPQSVLTNYRTDEFAINRFYLKNAWNTTYESGSSNPKRILGSFRAVNNAGDLLCRQNYSCGGSCQTSQSRPGLHGLSNHFGNISSSCSPSVLWSFNQVDQSIPASACNPKFVYDGSDYIKFKKDQELNRNYNDRSFGGNNYSGSQSVIRRIRK